jgi:hypothetical protein
LIISQNFQLFAFQMPGGLELIILCNNQGDPAATEIALARLTDKKLGEVKAERKVFTGDDKSWPLLPPIHLTKEQEAQLAPDEPKVEDPLVGPPFAKVCRSIWCI